MKTFEEKKLQLGISTENKNIKQDEEISDEIFA